MTSSSRSSTHSSQTSTTQVQNLNLQDTAGITVADASDVQVTTTDFSAIESAAGIAETAISAGAELTQSVVDRSQQSLGESLGFARQVFAEALQAAAGALDAAQDQVAGTTAALGEIAREQSTSESSRLQQVTLYALAAVALIVIFGRAGG